MDTIGEGVLLIGWTWSVKIT